MTENDMNLHIDININCSICTDNLEKNNTPIKTLDCNHQYHTDCIDIWLKEHNTCPLCRQEVKKVSVIYNNYTNQNINQNTEINTEINTQRNTQRNKIKRYVLYFLFYILLLSGAIAYIITLSSTLNYIEDFNNTNSSNDFHKKKIVNNIIIIIVYIVLLSIVFFSKIFFGNRNCINICAPHIIILLTIFGIYFNVLNNNDITNYIKSLNDTNNINDKKINNYIITRNLIILIYNSISSSFYVLFIHCIFEIIECKSHI